MLVLKRLRSIMAGWAIALTIVGCSDSPGGGGIGGTGRALITASEGVVIGPINGFGSIIINDLRFETDTANVFINGEAAILADLRVGMNVEARVDYDRMEAELVRYQPLITGPVEVVSDAADSLVALGQNVLLFADTVLDEITLADLRAGAIVEISGDRDAQNNIVAVYIRPAPDPQIYFTVGQVESRSEASLSALVSGVYLNYWHHWESTGLAGGDFRFRYPVEGSTVRTEINASDYGTNNADGTDGTDGSDGENGADGVVSLAGSEFRIVEDFSFSRGEALKISGTLAKVIDERTFEIKGVEVTVTDDTEVVGRYGDTMTLSDIANYKKVRVKGISTEDKKIIATKVVLIRR